MATIAEMMVEVGADTSQFQRETQGMQREMQQTGREMQNMARDMGVSAREMGGQWQYMNNEMKRTYKEAQAKMMPFKKAQQEVNFEFFRMAQSMKDYQGTTGDFMNQLDALGRKQKAITDEMMKNNDMMKQGFIQGIAAMSARSTQSEKIAKNFTRMGNPLYTVNNGLLRISDSMGRMAMNGNPARLALEMLGPTANMKDLNDMVMMINQGIMRMTAVSIAAAAASALLYGALHKAAMAMDPKYAAAFNDMMTKLKKAFEPMVQAFAMMMIPLYKFIAGIAELIIKFNEAHPTIALMIQGILMLIPILTLILSPLAIGIGLFAGMRAAMNAMWLVIGPLVEGLAAMMGTVLIVAAVIVGLAAAFIYAWNHCDAFRNGIISAWEMIKTATMMAWNFILNSVLIPVWNAIVQFGSELFGQLKDFWQENGDNITQIAETIWNFVKDVVVNNIKTMVAIAVTIFNVLKSTIQEIWGNIKGIISGALDVILGVIGFFSSVLTGDWEGAWESVQQILSGAWDMISNAVEMGVNTVLGIVSGLGDSFGGVLGDMASSFYNAGKGFMDMLKQGIESAIGSVVSTISSVAGQVRDFLPFSPAKVGPLSDLDHLDFGGPITDSINKALPLVQGKMNTLMQLPPITQKTMLGQENRAQSGGFNPTVNIQATEPLSPSETARKTTMALRGLGAQWRLT